MSRENGGVDAAFSMEPEEMKILVQEIELAWQALGNVNYGATKQELKSMVYRRSLYITLDLKVGEKITNENMRAIRPGYGFSQKYFELVLGRTIKKDVKVGTVVDWNLICQG